MTRLIKKSLKQGNAGWKAEKAWLCFTELRKFRFRSGDADIYICKIEDAIRAGPLFFFKIARRRFVRWAIPLAKSH